jgi:hypothetical protein
MNLIELMPTVAELKVYDNSIAADPQEGRCPQPLLVLHVAEQRIVRMIDLPKTPGWARPVVAAALTRRK